VTLATHRRRNPSNYFLSVYKMQAVCDMSMRGSMSYFNDNHYVFYPPGTEVFDGNVIRAKLERINDSVARIYFTDGANNNALPVPAAATLVENAGIGDDGNGRLMPVAAYRNEFIITYIGAYVMRWNGDIWFSMDLKREQAVRAPPTVDNDFVDVVKGETRLRGPSSATRGTRNHVNAPLDDDGIQRLNDQLADTTVN
jgi:hypothetical protein